jgi:CRISPR-associated protein Cas6
MGDRLRADHNYRLYSALVERMPQLKDCEWQLKTINGIPDHQGWVKLGRKSRLGVRCDLSLLGQFGTLDGQVLRIGQNLIQLGTLTGQSLHPTTRLRARLVVIKQAGNETDDKVLFAVALGKKLGEMDIKHLPLIGGKRVLRIRDNTVCGYEVTFPDLSYAESLTLQRRGIGGKRRMGCGVFE